LTASLFRVPVSLLAVVLFGCVGPAASGPGSESASDEVYRPDRRDYFAFREAYPDLVEPNYLPFMVHRMPGHTAAGDDLLFCRWSESSMPLAVYIESPSIPSELQNEFSPVAPDRLVQAVGRALETWERELEGLVRFRRVEEPAMASLRLRLIGEAAPTPESEIQVLGATEALREACRTHGWDPDSERVRVSFGVPELTVYVADGFGLLTPDQVERVAMHEIGHALGMKGHSPFSTDFMFRILHDRRAVARLSDQDVNSFVSLYRLPNGAHYGYAAPGDPPTRPDPGPPGDDPELSVGPYVDARLGFEVRTPSGWMRAPDEHGLFASNGPIWDHDASFEIFVWPYSTIESYLDRFSRELFADTWRRYSAWMVVNGRRSLAVAVEDPAGRRAMDFIFVELGDGRVMVILTECPVEVADAWRPWFQAALASLEIWHPPGAEGAGDSQGSRE
jgi:hypothetical protein